MNSPRTGPTISGWLRPKLEARLAHLIRPEGSTEEDFLQPRGEPALLAADSVSWKIFKRKLKDQYLRGEVDS